MRNSARVLLAVWLTLCSAFAEPIPIPAILNGNPIGEVNAEILGDRILIEISSLLEPLRSTLTAERLQALQEKGLSHPMISTADLHSYGVTARYNPRTVQIELEVIPEFRRLAITDFRRPPEPYHTRELHPSPFSAYLNFRGGLDYYETPSSALRNGLQDPQFSLEPVLNYQNLVLETELRINPLPDKTLERGDTRLIYDDVPRRIRYQLGDVVYATPGFQSFIPLAGFSVGRNNSLQPYRVTEPLGNTAFVLRQDSKVEVILNQNTVQTLELRAGPHNLRNFPFSSGGNEVLLKITDPVGRVEYVRLSFFFDPTLLLPGEHEFAYTIGLPSRYSDHFSYDYEDEPVFLAYHRLGIFESLTLGANLQLSERNQMAGPSVVVASPIGIFAADTAFSQTRDRGLGHAFRFQYKYYTAEHEIFRQGALSLGAQYRGRRFATYSPFALSDNLLQWDLFGRYSQRFFRGMSGSIGYSRQFYRTGRQTDGLSATLSKRWRRLTTDLTLERRTLGTEQTDYRAFLSLIFILDQGHSLFTTFDTANDSARMDYHYNPPQNVRSWRGHLGYHHSDFSDDLSGTLAFTDYRGEISLSQDLQYARETFAHTALRLGSALVYSEGEVALSRPIRDSFIILKPEGALAGQPVGILPQGNEYSGRADQFGSGVVPDLSSYHYYPLHIEPFNPTGLYEGTAEEYLFRPTYRSGAVLRIGKRAGILLTGRLLDPAGQPIALQAGELIAPDGHAITFITNREGGFFIPEPLRPGSYSFRFFSDPEKRFELAVPKTEQEIFDLGEMRLREKIKLNP